MSINNNNIYIYININTFYKFYSIFLMFANLKINKTIMSIYKFQYFTTVKKTKKYGIQETTK